MLQEKKVGELSNITLSKPLFTPYIFASLSFSSSNSITKMMNDHGGGEYNPCCYFHPKQVVVGVCALCLWERLLNLALKQSQHPHIPKDSSSSRPLIRALRRKTSITIPKVFALGSFLRLDTQRPRPDDSDSDDDRGSIASLEDSFISIKFEHNGEVSWDSKKKKKKPAIVVAQRQAKSLVEHSKPRTPSALRWRKRIGQLLQLARRKRSAGGGAHAGGGWMGSLTSKRRATGS